MRLQWLFLPFLMLLYLIPLSAEGISFGYGLDYSLNASAIDGGFNDLSPGGHTSYFYVSFPISRNFSLIMTPGAYNLEEGGPSSSFSIML